MNFKNKIKKKIQAKVISSDPDRHFGPREVNRFLKLKTSLGAKRPSCNPAKS